MWEKKKEKTPSITNAKMTKASKPGRNLVCPQTWAIEPGLLTDANIYSATKVGNVPPTKMEAPVISEVLEA